MNTVQSNSNGRVTAFREGGAVYEGPTFTRTQNDIADEIWERLGFKAYAVYCRLARHAHNITRQVTASQGVLAKGLDRERWGAKRGTVGCSTKFFREQTQRLKDAGYIEIEDQWWIGNDIMPTAEVQRSWPDSQIIWQRGEDDDGPGHWYLGWVDHETGERRWTEIGKAPCRYTLLDDLSTKGGSSGSTRGVAPTELGGQHQQDYRGSSSSASNLDVDLNGNLDGNLELSPPNPPQGGPFLSDDRNDVHNHHDNDFSETPVDVEFNPDDPSTWGTDTGPAQPAPVPTAFDPDDPATWS